MARKNRKTLDQERDAIIRLYNLYDYDEEFTTEQAVNKLIVDGFRNVPSRVGLGQMLKTSYYFENVGQKQVIREYRESGYKYRTKVHKVIKWKKKDEE